MNDIMAIFKLNSSLYCPVVRSRSLINVWNERKFFFIVFFRWTVHKPNINSPGILFVPHWTFESESWHPVPSCDHQVPNTQRQGFLTLQGETHVQVHHCKSVIIIFTCMHRIHFGIYYVHIKKLYTCKGLFIWALQIKTAPVSANSHLLPLPAFFVSKALMCSLNP